MEKNPVVNKPSFNEIVADADAHRAECAARASNVVPLKANKTALPASRLRVTEWTREVVAERALDLYALERTADSAYGMAIQRAEEFKELNDIEGHVDHKREDFRLFTENQWNSYLDAKGEVKKAKARLTTACRNCLHGVPKRERINPKDIEAWKALFAQIREGTICIVAALAVRDSRGEAFVKSREAFIALQAPDEDSDFIPF